MLGTSKPQKSTPKGAFYCILPSNLPANLTVRVLNRMHIHIGVAAFELADKVAKGFALQRTHEILVSNDATNNTSSDGNAKFGWAKQEDSNGAVAANTSKMNMSLCNAGNISNDKRKTQLCSTVVQLENGVASCGGSNRRNLISTV